MTDQDPTAGQDDRVPTRARLLYRDLIETGQQCHRIVFAHEAPDEDDPTATVIVRSVDPRTFTLSSKAVEAAWYNGPGQWRLLHEPGEFWAEIEAITIHADDSNPHVAGTRIEVHELVETIRLVVDGVPQPPGGAA